MGWSIDHGPQRLGLPENLGSGRGLGQRSALHLIWLVLLSLAAGAGLAAWFAATLESQLAGGLADRGGVC